MLEESQSPVTVATASDPPAAAVENFVLRLSSHAPAAVAGSQAHPLPTSAPVPPPRKQSQFRDALASLAQVANAQAQPHQGSAATRQARDLTADDKRAVASLRQKWQATESDHSSRPLPVPPIPVAAPHAVRATLVSPGSRASALVTAPPELPAAAGAGSGLGGLRADRDLCDDEKRRVAATRQSWRGGLRAGEGAGAGTDATPSAATQAASSRDLTLDEKARVSHLRNVWKAVDGSGGASVAPAGFWGTGNHSKHPSRQLSEDARRSIAKTRAKWSSSAPWKQLFESNTAIPDRGLSHEEVARIAGIRATWKRLSEEERAICVQQFQRDFNTSSEAVTVEHLDSATSVDTVDLDDDLSPTVSAAPTMPSLPGDRVQPISSGAPISVARDWSVGTVTSLNFDDSSTTDILHCPQQATDDRAVLSTPRGAPVGFNRPTAPVAPDSGCCASCCIM